MKIHLRDNQRIAEDYLGSPGVVRAIQNGWMTVCGTCTFGEKGKITDDEVEVECLGCLGLDGIGKKNTIIIKKEY